VLGASYEPDGELTEKVMTKKDIKKRDEIADAISTKDMKDRYGDKNVKYAIATKIVMDKKKKKKEEMKEELDEKDKPFVKKLVKNLKKGSKTHEKQAKKLEKAMNEDITDEALTIQNWNVDDIKFTEIETVDIIKAKPLKESVDWRIKLIEKFKFSRSLGKFIIKGTKPLPKVTGKVKIPLGTVTKRNIAQNLKAPLNAVQTPLTKLKLQDVTKRTDIEKLTKKYKKVVKDPNFKSKVRKKYGVKPELGGGKPVSRDGMIMPKPDEASKTNKLIDKYKIEKAKKTTDIGSEKKILDAQQDPNLKKLDKIDQAQDKLLAKVNKTPLPKTDKSGLKPKGFTSTKSGNVTRKPRKIGDEVKSGVKKALTIGIPALAGFKVGYDKGLNKNMDDYFGPPSEGEEDKPMIKAKDEKKKKTVMASYDWRAELDEDWQKVNRQDKTDGLSKKAVKAYRRENPGSKLKTAVTKDPKKLKKGSKDAKRRLSFCRRMKGMKKRLTSAKTARDPDSRINKALRRWNC
jgi:hypothetical protein